MRLTLVILVCRRRLSAQLWRANAQQAESLWKQHRYDRRRTTSLKRSWRRIRATPNTASAGAACTWNDSTPRKPPSSSAKRWKSIRTQAGRSAGIGAGSRGWLRSAGRRVRAQGGGSRSALLGGAGIARAPGARRQRPCQGGGRGAQGPRHVAQMPSRPEPSSPPSTG